jgi:hypothetical protein
MLGGPPADPRAGPSGTGSRISHTHLGKVCFPSILARPYGFREGGYSPGAGMKHAMAGSPALPAEAVRLLNVRHVSPIHVEGWTR